MRILILSASVGSGHLRAAEAMELALKEMAPGAEIRNVDVLRLSNGAFRRVYGGGYLQLVERAPHVLGFLYDSLNRGDGAATEVADRLRRALQRVNLRALERLLIEERWDFILNTHFLPAEIVASLRRSGRILTPHATVITDFEAHRIWIQPPCERYFVATDEAAAYLNHHGVPASSVQVSGIPIHPAFGNPGRREDWKRAHGLTGERPVILQMAGGSGVGPMLEVYAGLLSVEQPLQIVAVAGRNEAARDKLERMLAPKRHRTRVLGYTDKMHELMAAADLVVTKPGGLTMSEALASGAAMAVIQPIPGQESRNSDFLLENGAGIRVNTLATLPRRVAELLAAPGRLAALKNSARGLGRPKAAEAAAETVLELAASWAPVARA